MFKIYIILNNNFSKIPFEIQTTLWKYDKLTKNSEKFSEQWIYIEYKLYNEQWLEFNSNNFLYHMDHGFKKILRNFCFKTKFASQS